MKKLRENCILFSVGGVGYALLEILWRRKTHWTMAVTGGIAFISLYNFFKNNSKMKMLKKCISGSAIITGIEFCCGCVVNLKYKLNVWDYSNCRFNLKGQICPFYSFLWALLCVPVSRFCELINKKISS